VVTSPNELRRWNADSSAYRSPGQFINWVSSQQALDSAALQAEQEQLVPPSGINRSRNDGRVKVGIATAQGHTVSVWVTYYRRRGQDALANGAGGL